MCASMSGAVPVLHLDFESQTSSYQLKERQESLQVLFRLSIQAFRRKIKPWSLLALIVW